MFIFSNDVREKWITTTKIVSADSPPFHFTGGQQ
uniref:Uncharacterized protein n=1 Tax=Arundo donax TaxID=35708 RepID=A0A0A8ZN90_ARUDO